MIDNKKINSVEFVKDWCITILKFMSDQYSEDAVYKGRNYKVFFNDKIDRLVWAFENYGKRGMKSTFRDITELARTEALNKDALNQLLLEKFGQSLIDDEKEIKKVIKRIDRRGKINTDEEFYLVKSYIDEVVIEGNKNQAAKLDILLYEYENRKS